MRVLVMYASKYGHTRGIAERAAARLQVAGLDVEVRSVDDPTGLEGFDAFVVGSAMYFGHWLSEATAFVLDHHAILAAKPTWLFSSGPLGTEPTDAEGRDVRTQAAPSESADLEAATHARALRVFFGALDPDLLSLRDRLLRALPAGRALFPEGDFRDWSEIDGWADDIAATLKAPPPAPGAPEALEAV